MSGKKICFFVHECMLESGHTRAMLEVFRALPGDTLEEIHLVYFEGQESDNLLPNFKGSIIHHKVPGKTLFPFLTKAVFFQIWCFFFIRLCLDKDVIKVGIGTACLGVDICNIQFIQTQWKDLYFKDKSVFSFRFLYKKILFYYFIFCENLLFRDDQTKFLSLSHFITKYLTEEFQVTPDKIKTEYSSVNLDDFPLPTFEKRPLFEELKKDYKCLEGLSIDSPIFLFVGAFERKGLTRALEQVSSAEGGQIIVIGKGEHSQSCPVQEGVKVFHILFTQEIELFYQLSDYFIFPTNYEPFGLVIAEAAAMGNIVLTLRKNVGASEILGDLPSVIFTDIEEFDFKKSQPLTLEKRLKNASLVRERLGLYSWTKPAKALEEFLSSF